MWDREGILRDVIPIILKLIEPDSIIKDAVAIRGNKLYVYNYVFDLSRYRRIIVYGYGKASYHMFNTLRNVMKGLIDEAYVIVDKRMDIPRENSEAILLGSHPLPDEQTIESSQKLLESAETLGKGDLAINLISGGGSSLFEVPYQPLSLEDILPIWRELIRRGCNINKLNIVRRHLSRVKGGRFASITYPGEILSLIISDVVGDPLHDIASGPTAPDPTTYMDAYNVIKEFGLDTETEAVKFILDGLVGRYPETLKPGDKIFDNTTNLVIGSLNNLATRLEKYLKDLGLKPEIVRMDLQGSVDEITRYISTYIEINANPGVIYVFGGEAYSKVLGDGIGGPNHELTLKLYRLLKAAGFKAQILCIDTDGIDGNSPSAGGVIDTYSIDINGETLDRHLNRSDSYTLLKSLGLSIETGPTGSNLNSIWMVYILS